jgi:serine/threonine-protein phosphatase 5
MNKVYGFEGEAKSKYGDMTYKLFADVFTARTLPFPLRVWVEMS